MHRDSAFTICNDLFHGRVSFYRLYMLYGIDGSHVPQYFVGFSLKMYINPLMLTLQSVESVEITPLVIEVNLVMDMIKPWKGPKGAMDF